MKNTVLFLFVALFFANASAQLTGSEKLNNLTIFPQPASDHITFEASERIQNVTIYSLSGALIQTHHVDYHTITLPIFDLPKGIYLAKIYGYEGKEQVEKITVY